MEVCGSHVSSALGCDDATAVDIEVDASGSFSGPLHVARPPAPCPCTVRVRSNIDDSSITTPIEITDMDVTAEPIGQAPGTTSAPDAHVVVSDVELTGDSTWTTWFGASPTRTFHYTLTNDGGTLADDMAVGLSAGPQGDPNQVLRAPPTGSLEPGESRSYEVPVDLGPFAHGDFEVAARLVAPQGSQRFGAETSSFPWMVLIVPGLILLEVLLLAGRNALRTRVQRSSEASSIAPAVAAAAVARLEGTRAAGVDARSLAGRVVARLPRDAGAGAAAGTDTADDADPRRSELVGSAD
ncbi:hypothetical protein [Aquihabitans sp. McL0605]|uniref:hypothetical protein n=1 Tax=Aquihabitans sp. McL0605 TaxID=3415671 RepID=UPI003CF9CB74